MTPTTRHALLAVVLGLLPCALVLSEPSVPSVVSVTEGSTLTGTTVRAGYQGVGAKTPTAADERATPDALAPRTTTARSRGTSGQHVSDTPVPRALLIPRGSPLTVERDDRDLELAIHQAAIEFNVDGAFLLRVARCESRLDPNAIGDGGMSLGVMQFQARTFVGYARLSGLGYTLADIGDPQAQIRLAAWAFADGRAAAWTCAR